MRHGPFYYYSNAFIFQQADDRIDFKEFQDLDILIQIALARGTEEQDAGLTRTEEHLAQYIIENHNPNYPVPLGQLIEVLHWFISNEIRCRMVRCYVDNKCNMVASKLAWHRDY